MVHLGWWGRAPQGHLKGTPSPTGDFYNMWIFLHFLANCAVFPVVYRKFKREPWWITNNVMDFGLEADPTHICGGLSTVFFNNESINNEHNGPCSIAYIQVPKDVWTYTHIYVYQMCNIYIYICVCVCQFKIVYRLQKYMHTIQYVWADDPLNRKCFATCCYYMAYSLWTSLNKSNWKWTIPKSKFPSLPPFYPWSSLIF